MKKGSMDGVDLCQTHFYTSFILISMVVQVFGVVEIIETKSPQIFKVGELMSLKCISNEQKGLQWTRMCPATDWQELAVTVAKGTGWEERYLTIRPSGYVESILVRKNLQDGDGGYYFCYDSSKEHSFSTFVHVLKVSYKNVTAHNSTAVTLTCSLTGFTTNPPRIDNSWVRKELELVKGARPKEYDIPTSMGASMSLNIFNPNKHDTGPYRCYFIMYLNNGDYVKFFEDVYLDADHLDGTGSHIWSPLSHLVILLCLIIHHIAR